MYLLRLHSKLDFFQFKLKRHLFYCAASHTLPNHRLTDDVNYTQITEENVYYVIKASRLIEWSRTTLIYYYFIG